MLSLAETQARFRDAISGGPADAVVPLLRVPGDPLERLEIYRRHYRESFRRHLRGRYPTIEWLVGTDRMIAFADTLLAEAPPQAPSLAEYGEGLVEIVSAARGSVPHWLADVARLDWHLGCVSVAVAHEPVAITALAALAPEILLDVAMQLQPGLVFLQSDWPVDRLVHLRLGGGAPAQLQFDPEHVCLQLRGARGQFALQRLASADYAFRRALAEGRRLGAAAERALGADRGFDLSSALARLFAEGLVTAIQLPKEPSHV